MRARPADLALTTVNDSCVTLTDVRVPKAAQIRTTFERSKERTAVYSLLSRRPPNPLTKPHLILNRLKTAFLLTVAPVPHLLIASHPSRLLSFSSSSSFLRRYSLATSLPRQNLPCSHPFFRCLVLSIYPIPYPYLTFHSPLSSAIDSPFQSAI